MKCTLAIWCITFIFLPFCSCIPPISVNIKIEAEKIISTQQYLRKICMFKIHDKERKAIKAQLNKIIFLCNKAYNQAENEECARTFLSQAQEIADAIRLNPLIKTTIAAL